MADVRYSKRCLGQYCGRLSLDNGSLSECGPCPPGYHAINSMCEPCSDVITGYAVLFLISVIGIPPVINALVAYKRKVQPNWKFAVYTLYCFAECFLASFISIYLFSKSSLFDLRFCEPKRIADFYTLFHNPLINFTTKLHCTHEAVYPLLSLTLTVYAFDVLLAMVLRPLLRHFLHISNSSCRFHLYFMLVMAFLYPISAGALYYSYSYILLFLCHISTAYYLFYMFVPKPNSGSTWESLPSPLEVIKKMIVDYRTYIALPILWVLTAGSMVASISSLTDNLAVIFVSSCVFAPLPTVYFLLTLRHTTSVVNSQQ